MLKAPVSIDKQYKTRDGREVRIYATDGGGNFPVHGAIRKGDGWAACTWTADGRCYDSGEISDMDLVEVKPRHKRTVWLNVYPPKYPTFAFPSKPYADESAAEGRIACLKIDLDFEEGEGL